MLVEQVVEVLEHLRDALPVLVGGPLERLLHPGEALVEHLPAEQVADLLVILSGLRAAPVVVGEFLHGLRRRRRQFLDPHLGEPRVVVEGPGQFFAFLEHGAIEKLAHLLEGAVEVGAVEQLPSTPIRLRGKLVEATHTVVTAAQQLPQGALG